MILEACVGRRIADITYTEDELMITLDDGRVIEVTAEGWGGDYGCTALLNAEFDGRPV